MYIICVHSYHILQTIHTLAFSSNQIYKYIYIYIYHISCIIYYVSYKVTTKGCVLPFGHLVLFQGSFAKRNSSDKLRVKSRVFGVHPHLCLVFMIDEFYWDFLHSPSLRPNRGGGRWPARASPGPSARRNCTSAPCA